MNFTHATPVIAAPKLAELAPETSSTTLVMVAVGALAVGAVVLAVTRKKNLTPNGRRVRTNWMRRVR